MSDLRTSIEWLDLALGEIDEAIEAIDPEDPPLRHCRRTLGTAHAMLENCRLVLESQKKKRASTSDNAFLSDEVQS